jgi:glycolate oxidase FAD binding subunit
MCITASCRILNWNGSEMQPADLKELQEAIADAKSLEVLGNGTKRGMARPVKAEGKLDLSRLNAITSYEPEELVFSALAGTSRQQAEAALTQASQMFAFEPPDLSALLGTQSTGTLGGMIATNLSGPRRLKAGAVRDHVLGFEAVSGRGEIFKAGGRVVKNVTGYDLPKLMTGSWGTLAVLHEVTLKVLPRPESEMTLVVHGLAPQDAAQAMSAAMGSAAEVSGAAYLPQTRDTFIRIEGITPSLFARRVMLETVLKHFGPLSLLAESISRAQWIAIRDAVVLNAGSHEAIWRVSVAPMDGHRMLDAVQSARGFMDWAGGLVWLALPDRGDAGAGQVQAAVKVLGGHALLIRAAQNIREKVDCMTPEPAPLAALNARVKSAFDPQNILNPGRMR